MPQCTDLLLNTGNKCPSVFATKHKQINAPLCLLNTGKLWYLLDTGKLIPQRIS